MLSRTLSLTAAILLIAVTAFAGITTASAADSGKGLITIIVNDPSNPYWRTEGQVAATEARKLGYEAKVVAHHGDTNTERNEVDTAITNHAVAIILDPANAKGSIGSVKKAKQAGIPVFIVNAEIDQQGLAKAQLVSNNAQGAALGAQQWVKMVGDKAKYAELKGPASDNNAATRHNGYKTVLSQYPGLERVAVQVADWDRTKGHNKMQGILQAHPEITGVISGNDEMALGAIAALKQAGKLDQVTVGGFDGSPDAVEAIKNGELAYTVLQPVAVFAKKAVQEADQYIKTGSTGVDHEKQLLDCILITKDNVDNFVAPFTLKSMT
ncbi:D-ribose ABC transporter substrate-binding protein [Salinisphaera sp.]|uniref:D-ribose ABC transporter substrate-binding protein n=1 Tax=Salinisphaera sp. TaxID=1914330 RepID=UPI002D777186|nr:D-ribose ABC transporter substrate-binding protein [Salinisphaera sp.]HET7313473.1 D-ribose ABC transporter substrate-binding protein [Salinisphaera sp.]